MAEVAAVLRWPPSVVWATPRFELEAALATRAKVSGQQHTRPLSEEEQLQRAEVRAFMRGTHGHG